LAAIVGERPDRNAAESPILGRVFTDDPDLLLNRRRQRARRGPVSQA
jgi:hypothetical protein